MAVCCCRCCCYWLPAAAHIGPAWGPCYVLACTMATILWSVYAFCADLSTRSQFCKRWTPTRNPQLAKHVTTAACFSRFQVRPLDCWDHQSKLTAVAAFSCQAARMCGSRCFCGMLKTWDLSRGLWLAKKGPTHAGAAECQAQLMASKAAQRQ